MQILEMRSEHITQIRLIEQLTGITPWSTEDYIHALQNAHRWSGWVMMPGENGPSGYPLGFALMALIPPESELGKLAVHPEWQRKGIATALLAKAIGHARARNCSKCFLEVRSTNEGAIAFYLQHGFIRSGLRKSYYRDPLDDAVIMVCPIDQL